MDSVDVAEHYDPEAEPAARDTEGTSLIQQLDAVDVNELNLFHRNPRRGSVPAIRGSLQTNGQYKPIVTNRGSLTGRPNEVLAGNHTLLAARDLRWKTVVVVWVDVDDEQAARINLADNRVPELGDYDDRLLAELLADLPDLDGTGYDPGDLDDLLAAIEEANDTVPTGPQIEGEMGMRQTNTLGQDADNYSDRDTRMVVLTYSVEEFEWVVGELAVVAEDQGLDSNSDAVAWLLKARSTLPA